MAFLGENILPSKGSIKVLILTIQKPLAISPKVQQRNDVFLEERDRQILLYER